MKTRSIAFLGISDTFPCNKHRYAIAVALLVPMSVFASGEPTDKPVQLDEVLVTTTGSVLEGEPRSATEGVVLQEQLEQRPASRSAELLEFVPGMIATQHSGEGKANQYFLRGFNLDHGTDFAIEVDGLPVNMRSHAHGQGYADLNFLMPELVRSLEYRKGLLYAEAGDFATAGSAEFHYVDRLPQPVVELAAGGFDYRRVFAAGSSGVRDGELLAAANAVTYDGPWLLEQDLEKLNALLKYSHETTTHAWSATAMAYRGEWNSSDQVPLRAVEDGRIDRLGFVDPTDGGESHRYSFSADYRRDVKEGEWGISGYALDYYLDLFSNFTYFLENTINGDQFEQYDDRQVYGFESSYTQPLSFTGDERNLRFGVQFRHDDIATVGLYRTRVRERLATVREDTIGETSLGIYGEVDQQWNLWLRSVLGARIDHYRFDVDAARAENSGNADDTLVSPKLGLVFGPWNKTEYFVGIGGGFHSNDARGTTISIDPVTGHPARPVDPLVPAWGVDIGLRTAIIPCTQLAVSLFTLQLDSELVFVGDAGGTETNGESERYGLELAIFHTPVEWLIVDADFAWTRARFVDAGAADRIPNTVEYVASLGVTIDKLGPWTAGLRVRHFGAAPLIEDNSVRSEPTTLINAQAGYRFDETWSVVLAGFNLLGSDDRDITYYYASRLPGEPLSGAEDLHFHPVEPRHFRVSLKAEF